MTFVTATATPITVAALHDGDLFRFRADGPTSRALRVTRHSPDQWVPAEHYTVEYSGYTSGTWIRISPDAPVWLVHRPGDGERVSLAKTRYARPIVEGDLIAIGDRFQGRPMHVVRITDRGDGPRLCVAFSADGDAVARVRPADAVLVRA
ncbi:hypothetical protein ACGFJT_37045 [Actinomadura geliboluensis]|uniref:hypothetical protein n=1 Tax=Actinomadura geliboluensis TaxID=882440 RepID=UPI00371A7A9B